MNLAHRTALGLLALSLSASAPSWAGTAAPPTASAQVAAPSTATAPARSGAQLAANAAASAAAPASSGAPNTPLPAGHPGAALPPGHSAMGGAGRVSTELEADSIKVVPTLPAGTIEVELVTSDGDPIVNADMKLSSLFQKIAEGETKSERHSHTDSAGVARFSGLATGGDFSYRVSTRSGPAEYASSPMQLKEAGVRVRLHVYPVTRNVAEFVGGSRGFVYIETRDDVFQFEVLMRIFNVGDITWVPENARMALPAGFKAFKATESMDDARFEVEEGRGVRLEGTMSPGQHDVSFRFQLPRSGEDSAAFSFGLPPHTAEMRVIAEAAPSMQLDVEGFETPKVDANQNGQRVLVTRRVAQRGEANFTGFSVMLSGIPTPGWGRWFAAAIAFSLGLSGIAAFKGWLGERGQGALRDRDAERARKLLLEELLELEVAHREQRIGRGTYEQARRVLVESLARLDSDEDAARAAQPKGSEPVARVAKRASRRPSRPQGPASTG